MGSPAGHAGRPVPLRAPASFMALPGALRAYVAAVPSLAVLLLAVLAPGTHWRWEDAALLVLLLVCAGACVEASRRQGRAAGVVARDLLSAWWLPTALLLPPAYALVAPLPIVALHQWRVRTLPVHRRVFSVAALGLAGALGSSVFGALGGFSGVSGVPAVPGGARILQAVALALLVCVLVSAVNLLIVAIAVKADSPGLTWPEILLEEDTLLPEAAETSLGLLIALACLAHPLLGVLGLAPVLLLQRALLHQQLRAAARTDAKTGLLNAAAWEREAQAHLLRARRSGSHLAVLLLDLDHFKAVNDHFGHLAGDDVLRGVARTVQEQLRGYDLPCRFGGEELAVLLPDTDLDEAVRTAERLRRRIAALVVMHDEEAVRVTASLGVAGLQGPGQDVTDLLAAADAALYAAKAAGRDTVRVDGQSGLETPLG